jgi:hypothetical protein
MHLNAVIIDISLQRKMRHTYHFMDRKKSGNIQPILIEFREIQRKILQPRINHVQASSFPPRQQ